MNTLLSGKKFNSNHQTYLKQTESLLRNLKDDDRVKKINLGRISKAKGIQGTMKVKGVMLNGNVIKFTCRCKNAVQDFIVICNKSPEEVLSHYIS